MPIVTTFDSNMPINSCLKIIKEHLLTYFDGADHNGVSFPEADVFLEKKKFDDLLKLLEVKPQIRVQIVGGLLLDKRNGENEERVHRQQYDAFISVMTDKDTTGHNKGEQLSSHIMDLIQSVCFHKYVAFLESAGLDEWDVDTPVKVEDDQLFIWEMRAQFVCEISQGLVDPLGP